MDFIFKIFPQRIAKQFISREIYSQFTQTLEFAIHFLIVLQALKKAVFRMKTANRRFSR